MSGFFKVDDLLPDVSESKKTKKIGCRECGLYKTCNSPRMERTGNGKLGLFVIGEASGRNEDEQGEQWVGKVGQWLRSKLNNFDIDLDEDCYKINCLGCRPPSNRTPKPPEINACRPRVLKSIEEGQPKVILLLGGPATQSIIGSRLNFQAGKISTWRGWAIPDEVFNAWIVPTWHPSYVLRSQDQPIIEKLFLEDLDLALSCLDRKLPRKVNKDYEVLDTKGTTEFLSEVEKNRFAITIDYETTGLKPYAKGHKIVYVGISTGRRNVSFEYNDEIHSSLVRMLSNKAVLKINQNIKFEEIWSRVFLNQKVHGWHWDTMLASHALDNRTGITSLEFQSYVTFGVTFKDKTKPFLEAKDKKNANAFNQIYDCPKEWILERVALDAMLTRRLWLVQRRKLEQDKKLWGAYQLLFDGTLALADIEETGISSDNNYYEEQVKLFERKIDRTIIKLKETEGGQLWLQKYPDRDKEKGEKFTRFNPNSDPQLADILKNGLKLKPNKKTKGGNISVSEESLEEYSHIPLVNYRLKYKHLGKIKGTYLDGFIRETTNGILHPFFDLHKVVTYRSCVAKGTKILAVRDFLEYPGGVPIENINAGDYVYCFDDSLHPAIGKVKWAGKTGYKKVIRIHYRIQKVGTGYLDITPEHLIRLNDGKYVEAQNLVGDFRGLKDSKHTPKIRALSCRRSDDRLNFTGHLTNGTGLLESQFIYSQLIGTLNDGDIIHHKNGKHLDHTPKNLKKMNASEHGKHHVIDTLLTPTARKNNIIAIKNAWKEGRYKPHCGRDSAMYLDLSKIQCLRILSHAGGKVSCVPYSFDTFKKYLHQHKINPWIVRLRYDKHGRYISRGRLKKLAKLGRARVAIELGHNYYKLLKLYELYGIDTQRKWANQFGEFKPGNHTIIKIERINKYVDVYDIEVEKYHNFIANEICVHNSSSKPNFQNIPRVDLVAQKACRQGIRPRQGYQLIELDYAQMEVRFSCLYHKDEEMIRYVNEPQNSMHKDLACECLFYELEDITSDLKDVGKTGFVFPQFYGSEALNCALKMWKMIEGMKVNGVTVQRHLKEHGIKNKFDFVNHIEEVEHWFWYEKFPKYGQWRDELIKQYEREGYIENLIGFKCTAPVRRNQLWNWPIQGAAFLCLLWSIIKLNNIIKGEDLRVNLLGQIHDSIVAESHPDDLVLFLQHCK